MFVLEYANENNMKFGISSFDVHMVETYVSYYYVLPSEMLAAQSGRYSPMIRTKLLLPPEVGSSMFLLVD